MSDDTVIYGYSLKQAIEDGVLIELLKRPWCPHCGGKPVVVAKYLFEDATLLGLLEIWNEYVEWRNTRQPALPESEQSFHTTMNGKTVWVIEDGQAFKLLYPEDY
jgi:hypothetical protein